MYPRRKRRRQTEQLLKPGLRVLQLRIPNEDFLWNICGIGNLLRVNTGGSFGLREILLALFLRLRILNWVYGEIDGILFHFYGGILCLILLGKISLG
ncbi:hypothetical protein MtrunA17_Chr8g0354111 [Medicago truncatula]|uniref:Transmembrane protein, putative n=1 Tax=Medicago truncatula TaxID=3880 RepID=G7LIC9_MEDTR|nr:transmembrane protein, putative [Medicago truncatula]RHN40378.1 hypothetical protein MtrunA17_Chr8g0354111 [Medicago truncatula]